MSPTAPAWPIAGADTVTNPFSEYPQVRDLVSEMSPKSFIEVSANRKDYARGQSERRR